MPGLVLRIRLLLSLLRFTGLLLFYNYFQPYKSFLVVVFFFLWTISGIFFENARFKPTPESVVQKTRLQQLLQSELKEYSLDTNYISLLELRARERRWVELNMMYPNSRDVLLNGALLYSSLEQSELAKIYFEKAQSFDPNNPIFSVLFFEFSSQ